MIVNYPEDIVQEVLLKAWKDPSLPGSATRLQHAPGSSRRPEPGSSTAGAAQRRRHEQRMEDPPEESSGDATSVVLDRWLIAEALGSLSMSTAS